MGVGLLVGYLGVGHLGVWVLGVGRLGVGSRRRPAKPSAPRTAWAARSVLSLSCPWRVVRFGWAYLSGPRRRQLSQRKYCAGFASLPLGVCVLLVACGVFGRWESGCRVLVCLGIGCWVLGVGRLVGYLGVGNLGVWVLGVVRLGVGSRRRPAMPSARCAQRARLGRRGRF